MIPRRSHLLDVRRRLRSYPVVGILGPRQVGKTTLATQVADAMRGPVHRFDLEDSRDLDRLSDPMAALEPLRGLVILDEVQRRPELFPTLRVLADRPRTPARFLVLGSAAPGLLHQSSESLAGRIAYPELGGLDLAEAGAQNLETLWLRGGFPRAFLARSDAESVEWRRGLIRSYLERDLSSLGSPAAPETMRRFWTMLAHLHGQLWNASELSRSFGVSDKTVRGYLDFLASTYMVRILPPWFESLGKRQVKSPKVYFRDAGLLHVLSGIHTRADLLDHPRCGASWEGLALEEVLCRLRATPEEAYFWRTHNGAELDLLVVRGGKRLGFEFKRTTSPGLTTSMRVALADLRLSRLFVVHAGSERYALGERTEAVPLSELARALRSARPA
ncbi:MAG: ATP-binding protein [Planctomycetes bacterium]|nr:ATP-binding protein [Planctomycetota bacterium]